MIPHYIEPVYRPPGEASSLILQAAYGCPHNRCRFCGMYKGVPYRLRPEAELLREIAACGQLYPATTRIFLADGDIMALGYARLERILAALGAAFPRLARVGSYGNGSSLLRYTTRELAALRDRKLHTVYVGLESGSQALLDRVDKTERVEDMITAVRELQSAGLRASVMVLNGLGGAQYSAEHAAATADALNLMQPRLLSILRFVPVLGKPFPEFQMLSEYGGVAEMLATLEPLELEQTVFRADHASNPVPLKARFPSGKPALIRELQLLLDHGGLDADGPGRVPYEL